ncbi:MAG TPA: glutamate--cysteine ligase [Enteractinococcus sp.]
MRTFGVEEELLLVDATSLDPLPAGELTVSRVGEATSTGHQLTTEFKQEQLEVVSPPQYTLVEQLEAIRTGRALAEAAAAVSGGRVAAIPTDPGTGSPRRTPGPRNHKITQRFGITASEQLTNGFHIHVAIDSWQEGVTALDRIRIWLPLLLALSSNSPFWNGRDTGFASYRYQAWSRWPTAGPTEIFDTAAAYEAHRQAILNTKVPLDAGMLYFDARLCDHQPTLEVRVADICLKAEHAAVIAALARALVETAIRKSGEEAPRVPATLLRTWSWQASRYGVEAELINPLTGKPVVAADAIAQLLDELAPVLDEYNEEETIRTVVSDILQGGSGTRIQRQAYEHDHKVRDVISAVVDATHDDHWSPERIGLGLGRE